jgi:hypothetical protein
MTSISIILSAFFAVADLPKPSFLTPTLENEGHCVQSLFHLLQECIHNMYIHTHLVLVSFVGFVERVVTRAFVDSAPGGEFRFPLFSTARILDKHGRRGQLASTDFASNADRLGHLELVKELFVDTFDTPRGHPKGKPFIDRVMWYYYADKRVSYVGRIECGKDAVWAGLRDATIMAIDSVRSQFDTRLAYLFLADDEYFYPEGLSAFLRLLI